MGQLVSAPTRRRSVLAEATDVFERTRDAAQPGDGDGVARPRAPLPHVVPVGPVSTVMLHVEMSILVDGAERVVRSRLKPAAERCYGSALERDSREGGNLTLLLRVLSDGQVDEVRVAGTSYPTGSTGPVSAPVADCVASAARAVSFAPRPGKGAFAMAIRLVFTPRPSSGPDAAFLRGPASDMPSRRSAP